MANEEKCCSIEGMNKYTLTIECEEQIDLLIHARATKVWSSVHDFVNGYLRSKWKHEEFQTEEAEKLMEEIYERAHEELMYWVRED